MKVAIIGGGGSRTPLLYVGLLEHAASLGVHEAVLYDIDESALDRISRVLDGIDLDRGPGLVRRTTGDLDDALTGASFVIAAVRAGGFQARLDDESIPLRHGVLGQETIGPGGFALALRNVPVMEHVARRMAAVCPDAWLINLTNPAGLVTQAVRSTLNGRAIGVCDSPVALGRQVANLLDVSTERVDVEYGGLNHLGWATAVYVDGEDVLPHVLGNGAIESIEEVRLLGVERVQALGALPNEYLYFWERADQAIENIRRAGTTRAAFLLAQQSQLAHDLDATDGPVDALSVYERALAQRNSTYLAHETGETRPEDLDPIASSDGYHRVALTAMLAIADGSPGDLIVNTSNRGALPFLADDDVVEVTASLSRETVAPKPIRLPAEARSLIERVKNFERATLSVLADPSPPAAAAALSLHPLVPDRFAAEAIVDEYRNTMPAIASLLGGS